MKKNKGFSLIELFVTFAILALITSTVIGASIMLKDVCFASITSHELQRSAGIIMEYIIRRGPGEVGYNGLRSAASYDLSDYPTGNGIAFWDSDGELRKYYVQGDAIIYESGTAVPVSHAVYTAPPGVTISLRFSPVSPPGMLPDGRTVSIEINLSQMIRGKRVSGNLATWVNLMNR